MDLLTQLLIQNGQSASMQRMLGNSSIGGGPQDRLNVAQTVKRLKLLRDIEEPASTDEIAPASAVSEADDGGPSANNPMTAAGTCMPAQFCTACMQAGACLCLYRCA